MRRTRSLPTARASEKTSTPEVDQTLTAHSAGGHRGPPPHETNIKNEENNDVVEDQDATELFDPLEYAINFFDNYIACGENLAVSIAIA